MVFHIILVQITKNRKILIIVLLFLLDFLSVSFEILDGMVRT